MTIKIKLYQFTLALFAGLIATGAVHAAPRVTIATVAPSNQFGYLLAQVIVQSELTKKPNQNIFVSPLSAALALEMLLNGAEPGSQTYHEMSQTLQVDHLSLDAINHANRTLLASLQTKPSIKTPESTKPTPFTLMIANSAWNNSRSSFSYQPSFLKTLEEFYQATATQTDFSSEAGLAAINQWASDHTNGKIPSVLDLQTLKQFEFLLMNATYFKASWETPFHERATLPNQHFTRGDGSQMNVKMMKGLRQGYFENEVAQTMELPYFGGNASMYVILPKEDSRFIDALLGNEGLLSTAFWTPILRAEKSDAEFYMPKFGFSYEIILNDLLKTMGMLRMFTLGADLGMLGTPAMKVDLVKQNSFVRVDEKGTEAAAVTVIGGSRTSIEPPRVPVMKVNRPFVISIVEKSTGCILFLGVISNPSPID